MSSIWELPEREFYLICRRVAATRVLMQREHRNATIMRLVREGLQTAAIHKLTGYSKTTIKRVKNGTIK